MRNITLVFLGFVLFGFTIINTKQEILIGETFNIQINDSTQIELKQVIDKTTNLPIYYFSDLYVHACNTGECKMIDLKMFWDIYGNYFKYQIKKEIPLTKYNHKKFKRKDYPKLHLLLCDTASKFKNIAFSNLTEKQAKDEMDAQSGATIKLFSSDNIKGAVKTSHTLWHIANGQVKQRIAQSTEKYFSKNAKLLPIIHQKINTDESFKLIWQSFEELTLTQVAYLIRYTEEHKKETESIKELLKPTFETSSLDKKLLVSNYFLRPKTSCKRAGKLAKAYPFVK